MNINPIDNPKYAQETQTSQQNSKIFEDNLSEETTQEIKNDLQFENVFETQIIPQKTQVNFKETQTPNQKNNLKNSFAFELHFSPKIKEDKQVNTKMSTPSNGRGSAIVSTHDKHNQNVILFQPESNQEIQAQNNLKRLTTRQSGQNSDFLVSRSSYKKSRILSGEEYISRPEGLETVRVHNERQIQSSNKSKNNYFVYMDGPIIPGSFKNRKTNEKTKVSPSVSTPKVQPSQKSIQNRRNISPTPVASPITQENFNNQTLKSSDKNLNRQIRPLTRESSAKNDVNRINDSRPIESSIMTEIKKDSKTKYINEGTQTQMKTKNVDYQTEFSSSKYTSYNRRHSATQTGLQFSENVPNDKLIHLMHRTQTQEQTNFQQSSKPPRPTTATQLTQSTFNESNSQQRFLRSNQQDYMRQSQNLMKTDLQTVEEYFLISKSQLRSSPTLTCSNQSSLPGFVNQGFSGLRTGSQTILNQDYISLQKEPQIRKNVHAETSSSPFLIYNELQAEQNKNRYYSQSGSRQSQYFVLNYPNYEMGRVYGTKYNHDRFWSLGESRKSFEEKTINKTKWKKFIKIKDVKLVQSRVANLKIKALIKQNQMESVGPYDIKQETPKVKLKKFKIQWK